MGAWVEYEGFPVEAWPDNDGGVWFYHPISRRVVILND